MLKKSVSLILLLVLATCITLFPSLVDSDSSLAIDSSNIWRPKPGTTWYWQLKETVDTSVNAEVYDIDVFDNTKQLVEELHEKGKAVFAAEYTDQMNSTTFTDIFCNQAQQMKFSAILISRDLNGKPLAKCS